MTRDAPALALRDTALKSTTNVVDNRFDERHFNH
jgi:hypothetical protein